MSRSDSPSLGKSCVVTAGLWGGLKYCLLSNGEWNRCHNLNADPFPLPKMRRQADVPAARRSTRTGLQADISTKCARGGGRTKTQGEGAAALLARCAAAAVPSVDVQRFFAVPLSFHFRFSFRVKGRTKLL